jgi:hypothetical protein
MTKAEFLRNVREEHERWISVLERLDATAMLEPRLPGDRTAKDVVAHVSWYEQQAAGIVRQRALRGSELWERSQEERNAVIFAENRGRTLEDVLAEAERVFAELWELLQTLDEEELHDASRFADMPADWPPWGVLADNTYEHYKGHIPELQVALGTGAADASD